MVEHDRCNETVDLSTREEMLEEYDHRCQVCGRRGSTGGGIVTLHVHHLSRSPDGIDEHDPENLTVLCRSCHGWQHQQTTKDEVPVELTEADRTALQPQDIESLQILAESGPVSTSEIASALSADLTVTAVRERLWVLMGLDNRVESRDRQIVDQDADTDKWGLIEQIEHSSRGRIPSDLHLLQQRIEDEYVRQALERGCDRDIVMSAFDISRRTTFYKQHRAQAYDFPLDAIRSQHGGRPTGNKADDDGNAGDSHERSTTTGEAQQRLDAVADDGAATSTDTTEQTRDEPRDNNNQLDVQPSSEQSELREQVQEAIVALQALNKTL